MDYSLYKDVNGLTGNAFIDGLPAPGGTSEEEAPVPTKTLTEAERQARREADREKAAQAVEALTTSEGWQASTLAQPMTYRRLFGTVRRVPSPRGVSRDPL
ncbi:MAG: hypothetical protein JWR63_1461 [Conexibacter sp.]|nr:hypothetical protein [Conexibacter sp.]